jgi:hypothetical protein
MVMPHMRDGMLFHALKAARPGAKAVLVIGCCSLPELNSSLSGGNGMDAKKPLDVIHLAQIVGQAVRSSGSPSS